MTKTWLPVLLVLAVAAGAAGGAAATHSVRSDIADMEERLGDAPTNPFSPSDTRSISQRIRDLDDVDGMMATEIENVRADLESLEGDIGDPDDTATLLEELESRLVAVEDCWNSFFNRFVSCPAEDGLLP